MRPLFFTFLIVLGWSYSAYSQLVNKLMKDTVDVELLYEIDSSYEVKMKLYTTHSVYFGQCVRLTDSGIYLYLDTTGIIELNSPKLKFFGSDSITKVVYTSVQAELNTKPLVLTLQFAGSTGAVLLMYKAAGRRSEIGEKIFLFWPAVFTSTFAMTYQWVDEIDTLDIGSFLALRETSVRENVQILPKYNAGQELSTGEILRKSPIYKRRFQRERLTLSFGLSGSQFLGQGKYESIGNQFDTYIEAGFNLPGPSSFGLGYASKIINRTPTLHSATNDINTFEYLEFNAINGIYRYSIFNHSGVRIKPIDVKLGVGLTISKTYYAQSVYDTSSSFNKGILFNESQKWLVGPLLSLRFDRYFWKHFSLFVEIQQRLFLTQRYSELKLKSGNSEVGFNAGKYNFGGTFIYFGLALSI